MTWVIVTDRYQGRKSRFCVHPSTAFTSRSPNPRTRVYLPRKGGVERTRGENAPGCLADYRVHSKTAVSLGVRFIGDF